MFSIVAFVIHIDAAIPETTQLACCLNQCLCVVYSIVLLCLVLFYPTDDDLSSKNELE